MKKIKSDRITLTNNEIKVYGTTLTNIEIKDIIKVNKSLVK